ncbi:PHD-type domain-containing protein [Mycena venus]|uniref:PHD-type domain-containing protein n=1 Tax=Mycena venus TaxID=2733690 RepID=A0A8H7CKC5_9AGAR|nr:PHD-type domain-containing protein [Mycena venus]
MSTRASRKRRRSQAFPEEEEDSAELGKYVESTGQDRLDKEREVWDAFKDEYVEVFELSVSLPRRFHLVGELDEADTRDTSSLLHAFMKYVEFRRACAQPPSTAESDALETAISEVLDSPNVESETAVEAAALEDVVSSIQDVSPVTADTTASDQPMPPVNGPSSAPNNPPITPSQSLPAPAKSSSSREMLATIAKFSEASLRDREEKVNATLAACESVERSIRIIDQAIQEQEHLISLGARPGTHLAPILLPELVVPRWTKPEPARVTLSPDLDDVLGGDQNVAPAPSQRRKKKKGPQEGPPPRSCCSPPATQAPLSFGEMIACDDPRCEREWFHLTCTNLAAAPEGRKKWYCDDCVLRKKKKK